VPVTQLQFYQSGSYPYPIATTGSGTGMTVCIYQTEPALAVLTQTGYEDEIVYLALNRALPFERGRVAVQSPEERISGLCYDRQSHLLWACQTDITPDNRSHLLVALNPETGQRVDTINVPQADGRALAWNGLAFVRSVGSQLELINSNGTVIATRQLNFGEGCRGISASPWSFVATYGETRPLVVINFFAQVIGECANVPGTAGGIDAVAFDNLSSPDVLAQVPSDDGSFAPIGSEHDPEVPWDPSPWKFRHRIYVANESDQVIRFGYLFEQ